MENEPPRSTTPQGADDRSQSLQFGSTYDIGTAQVGEEVTWFTQVHRLPVGVVRKKIHFTETLFKLLRDMDAEAITNANGSATGLNWYGAHYEPQKKRPRTEVCWTLRLAELLPSSGYPTRAEMPYPNLRRCKCDNVITLPDGKTL